MRRDIDLGDRKVTLVGTAHISEESRKEVEETIEEIEPDLVGVELDEKRFESLNDRDGWKDLDLAEAIRDGKGYLLLMNLLLAVYQRRLGLEEGIEPGEELMAAVEMAENNNIDYALIDRDISETFERLRGEMTLKEKLFFLAGLSLGTEDYEIEELKETNILDQLMRELEDDFPSVKRVFLDERNAYMVEKLLERDFDHAVVVVGAAHVEGMCEMIQDREIEVPTTSKSIPWMKIFKYGFPLAIIAMITYTFYQIGFSAGIGGIQFWVLANGFLAMIGAILARSHIATWITSFLVSPITSLYPVVGAGMVAAYVEGKIYPPKVEEMEQLPYTTEYRDLWNNQAGRILLTFFLVSIGSSLAAFAGAGYIASIIL